MTYYGANLFVSQLLGITAVPAQYWIALCTDQPGEGMDGDILTDLEPDPAAGYLRIAYPTGPDHWALSGQFGTNLLTVDFGVPTAAWGRLSHYAVCDAVSSGNAIAFGEFLNPTNADASFDVLIPPGGLLMAMYGLENSIVP